MAIINSMPPVGRFFSEANRIDKSDKPKDKALALLLGISTEEFDLDVEGEKREKETRERLEGLLKQADLGYTFSRFSLNEEGKELAGE